MKINFCALLSDHKLVKTSEENAGGREFRFVRSCRCGGHIEKSFPLHENELLGNIGLNKYNFPVDEKVSVRP